MMAAVKVAAARLYIPLLICLGLLSLQPWRLTAFPDPVSLTLLTTIIGLSEFLVIRFRGGATNLSFPIAFAAFHLFGAVAGVWVAGVGAFAATVVRRRPLRAALINLGFCAVAAWAAGWTAEAAGRTSLAGPGVWPDMWNDLIELLLYSQVFFWTNVLLLEGLIWLRHGQASLSQWLANLKLQLTALGISGGYSVLFLLSHAPDNPIRLLVIFLPLFMIGFLWQASHDLRRSQERHALLFAMADHLTATRPLSEVAHVLLNQLRQVIPYDYAALLLRQPSTEGARSESLQMVALRVHGKERRGTVLQVPEGPIRRVLESGSPERIDDIRRENGWNPPEEMEALKACLLVPIVVSEEVRGVIGLGSELSHAFFPEDLRLLIVLSHQLRIAIQNLEIVAQHERLAVIEERNRLAREIHDGLAQQMAGMILRLEHLSLGYPTLSPEAKAEVAEVREAARMALREVRRSINDLRPLPLQETPFIPALRRVAQDLEKEGRVQIAFGVTGQPCRLKACVEDALFQIATESLNNVRRHAQASKVQLELRFGPQGVRLVVQDDGIGFELLTALQGAAPGERVGIVGMHERVRALAGRLVIDSKPGHGTRVEVALPYQLEDQASEGVG